MVLWPLQSQAATIVAPSNTIGVSEETFAEVQAAHCYYDKPCDDIILQLKDYIVMRVEHYGELYQINGGDGAAAATPYLPDGLYRTPNGKKLTLVQDGTKIATIKKGEAYKKLIALATSGDATAITETNYADMARTCEGEDVDCLASYNRGQDLFSHLRGRLVMRVEENGELYFVDSGTDNGPSALHLIEKRVGTESLFHYLKHNQTTVVSHSVLEQML